jgi:hypothetical protein
MPKVYSIHKDAKKVIKYMQELGFDQVIQERAFLAMYDRVEWKWGDSVGKGLIKTTSDKFIADLNAE